MQASRLRFVGLMHAADVDGDTIDEFEIVFSELTANAVAASPTTSHEVRARAHQLDDGMLMLEVSKPQGSTPPSSPSPTLTWMTPCAGAGGGS